MRPKVKDPAYFSYVAINKIKPSKLNPRRHFDLDQLTELARSFSEYGIIQPIIVYPNRKRFVIVCGERRWRAAKIAKFGRIPAIVYNKPLKDENAISMALIENLHRQNVDQISESGAIRNLTDKYGWVDSTSKCTR